MLEKITNNALFFALVAVSLFVGCLAAGFYTALICGANLGPSNPFASYVVGSFGIAYFFAVILIFFAALEIRDRIKK